MPSRSSKYIRFFLNFCHHEYPLCAALSKSVPSMEKGLFKLNDFFVVPGARYFHSLLWALLCIHRPKTKPPTRPPQHPPRKTSGARSIKMFFSSVWFTPCPTAPSCTVFFSEGKLPPWRKKSVWPRLKQICSVEMHFEHPNTALEPRKGPCVSICRASRSALNFQVFQEGLTARSSGPSPKIEPCGGRRLMFLTFLLGGHYWVCGLLRYFAWRNRTAQWLLLLL